jgi:hypothetical protein|tara:strand:+ start:1251 stop:1523 length:273 start_codon:yes stop_codon:yes gene_type:complete
MRRTEILKIQLLNSRGRFFTTTWRGPTKLQQTLNFKVTEVKKVLQDRIEVKAYVPSSKSYQNISFFMDKKGDLLYLSSDKTKIQLSGSGI